MTQDIINGVFQYYGLDWLAFISGITGMVMITRKSRWGFALSVLSCISGFATAAMSGQFGFVAYNLILSMIMVRGYLCWSKA